MFLLSMSFISLVKWTIFIFHEWRIVLQTQTTESFKWLLLASEIMDFIVLSEI